MIPDQDKTKEQLIAELNELRCRVNPLPRAESACSQEETRQVKELLKESEEHFRVIANYTYEWESWVGPDGKLLWVNPAVERITGYSREEYLNMPHRLKHIIFDDDQERILSHFENGIKYKKSGNDVKFRIRCKDGSLKWAAVSYQPAYTDAGECLGLRSSIRDINNRVQVQEQLQATNSFLDSLMENLPVAVFVKETKELKYVFWNTACENQIGVLKQDILGKTDYDVFSSEIAGQLTAMDRLTAETGELQNIPEERVDVPGKGTSFFRTKKVPLFNPQGLPEFILGIAENITEQRQKENDLRESEEKYRTLLNDLTDAVLLADDNGNIFEVNKKTELLLGYTAQELADINFAQLHIEQERDSIVNQVKTTLLPKGTWSLHDVHLMKKDGTSVPVDITGSFVEYAGKRVIQGVVQDISQRKAAEAELENYRQHLEELVAQRTSELFTLNLQLQQEIEEHKKTEEALFRSEKQFRTVIKTSSDAIITVNSSGNIVLWNKGAEEIYGYTAAEAQGKSFLEMVPEQLREAHKQIFSTVLAGQKPGVITNKTELSGCRKDGSEFLTEASAALWKTPDGTFITTIVRDITERKAAENSIKDSEDKFRSMAEQISAAVFIYQNTYLVYANTAAVKLSGYSREELPGMRFWDIIHPDLKEQATEWDRMQQAGEELPSHFELKIKTKNGEERWVDYTAATINYNGLDAVLGTAVDITERKHAEASLMESEIKLRSVTEHITASIIIYQDNHVVYANPAAEIISGYTYNELVNMNFWDIVHPDFREQAKEWGLRRQAGEELPPRYELKIKTKDGGERWVDYTAAIIDYNNLKAVLGTAVDITKRKHSEDLIRKVNDCLLNFSADPDKNIQSILDTAGTIFDGDSASYHKKQGDSVYIAMAWKLSERYMNLPPISSQHFDGMFGSRGEQPLILNRSNVLPLIKKNSPMLQMGFESFIATPIKAGNTLIGSVNVAFNDAKTFSPSELDIFSILAKAISIEEERKSVLEDLKMHQQELKQSEKSLKAFSGRILSIREEEKKNISSALHDELGSMVVALSSGLTIAREEIIESSLEPALKSIERTETALKDAVANLKKVIIDLRPPNLEIVGLSSALNSLCTTTAQQTKIAVDFSAAVADNTIGEDAAITLYRTAQEAINNVLKHARAKNIAMRLFREKNNLKLSITDDGRGFDRAKLDSGARGSTGIGIKGIQERVAALGGTFSLQSAPQKGTALHITIPAKKRRRT